MIGRAFARAYYVGEGAFLWSAPSYLVAWLAEPAWPYVFVPLLAYGAWRGATVRVAETPEALLVRNTVLSFRLPWDTVTGVDWREPLAAPHGFVVPCVRAEGRARPVPVLALPRWGSPARDDWTRVRGWAGQPPATPHRAAPPHRRPFRRGR